MGNLPEGWTRNEDTIAVPPRRIVSYKKADEADEHAWAGAITHERNVVTVYPDHLLVSVDLCVKSERELEELMEMLERAWNERSGLATTRPMRDTQRRRRVA